MKKVVLILLFGIVSLILTACGKSDPAPILPSVSSKSGTPYKEPSGNGGVTIVGDNNTAASKPSGTAATSEAASDYEIEDDLGGVSILRYHGEGGKVLIPSVINKQTVIKIDEHAFRGTAVTNVIVPGTVRTIETRAFSNCDLLETLSVSEGVEVIDGYAFANCDKLSLVTLPDSIREINAGAFSECPLLQLTYKGKTYTAVNVEELYEIF